MKPHWPRAAYLLVHVLPLASPVSVRAPLAGPQQHGGAAAPPLAAAAPGEPPPGAPTGAPRGAPRAAGAPTAAGKAWAAISNARRWEPHLAATDAGQQSLGGVFSTADRANWCFAGAIVAALVSADAVVLQHLPETARTHVAMLLFWLMAAVACCLEAWLRLGEQAGTDWLTGYLLELVLSADNVFVLYAILCALETPRRLTGKAMFAWLLGSVLTRLVLFLGVAPALVPQLWLVPYLVGPCLLYAGARHVLVHDDEGDDVTQAALVRAASRLLGDRLGKFYDEDGEALLVVSKGKTCLTLLSLVVLSLLAADVCLAVDVVLTKAERLPSTHLNFSSSALALFAVRALFFVARDLLNRCEGARYPVGLALMSMGGVALASPLRRVGAAASLAGVALAALAPALLPPLPGRPRRESGTAAL